MSRIEDSIEVNAPISTVYDQWTQFEEFPRFMEGVDRVVQLDDATLEWTATIAGVTRSWRARIIDQVPDQRISWQAIEGARNDGVVTFESLGVDRTLVNLALTIDPEGPVETAGDALGMVKARVGGDLERFRDFIEQRGVETGAWRGRVQGGQPVGAGTGGSRGSMGPGNEAAYVSGRDGASSNLNRPSDLPSVGAARTYAGASTTAAGRDLGPGIGSGRGFAEGETNLPNPALEGGIGAGRGFAAGETERDIDLGPGIGAGRGFAEGETALPDEALEPGPGAGAGFAQGETEAQLGERHHVVDRRDEAVERDLRSTDPNKLP